MDKLGSVTFHCPKFDKLPGTKFRKIQSVSEGYIILDIIFFFAGLAIF